MKPSKEERACQIAVYLIETGATVRAAGEKFGLSKSTVHKDLTHTLPRASPELFRQVRGILDQNKSERHIRGGIATRAKYLEKAKKAPGTNRPGAGNHRSSAS